MGPLGAILTPKLFVESISDGTVLHGGDAESSLALGPTFEEVMTIINDSAHTFAAEQHKNSMGKRPEKYTYEVTF